MKNFPDPIGDASRAQLLAQIDLAASLSSTAMENAGRLALLQIEAARQWTLNATEAWRHVLASAPPLDWSPLSAGWADLFKSGAAAQQGGGRAEWADRADGDTPAASAGDATSPCADLPLPEPAEPPAARKPLAAAAAEAVPGPSLAHHSATLPPTGRTPLPRVKPMEAAPAPPQVAGVPPPSRGRGRGAKK